MGQLESLAELEVLSAAGYGSCVSGEVDCEEPPGIYTSDGMSWSMPGCRNAAAATAVAWARQAKVGGVEGPTGVR